MFKIDFHYDVFPNFPPVGSILINVNIVMGSSLMIFCWK